MDVGAEFVDEGASVMDSGPVVDADVAEEETEVVVGKMRSMLKVYDVALGRLDEMDEKVSFKTLFVVLTKGLAGVAQQILIWSRFTC